MATKESGAPENDRAEPPKSEPEPDHDDPNDATAFILNRTRSEVHLLLDNISANPEVTIAALASQSPPKGLPKDWIEEVCKITWPPKDATPGEQAEQAALLIKTRDYLNGLAKPASGATIAFTVMVTQEENLPGRRRRSAQAPAPNDDMRRSPSRSSLACQAYPDLVPKARKFRKLLTRIIWLPIGWLLFTLFVSWYLAVGNAALADYATARARLAEADARVSQAQSALSGPAPPAAPAQQAVPGVTAGTPAARPAATVVATAAPAIAYLRDQCSVAGAAGAFPSAELRDACMARADLIKELEAVKAGLDRWALWGGPDTARWGANLLGTAVLPVLYGVLGAIAAVVRSLSRKIKGSLLSPRDVQLSFQQLALGALIGACISLFIAAPGGDSGDTTLLGPVALSSSAVSFVAGFGVNSVFQALEALISRIFNIAPAETGARQQDSADA